MAGSLNKVMIIGNLGQDPEIRSFQNGGKVANLRIATSEQWKDKNTGERQERTEWHKIVLWGKVAEVAAKLLSKGKQVYIEGRLQTREWEDQSGGKRYTTEIIANQMQILSDKGEGGGTHEPPVHDRAGRRMPEGDGQPQGGFDDIPF